MVTRRFTSLAMALLSATGAAAASELAPGNGYSLQLSRFDGVVYYTAEPDGYRVIATLAAGVEAQPIRFISTLEPGQRLVISVPQALGQPSVDLTIVRDGDALLVEDDFIAPSVDATEVSVIETVGR